LISEWALQQCSATALPVIESHEFVETTSFTIFGANVAVPGFLAALLFVEN